MAGVGGVNVPITGNSEGFKKAMASAQSATKKFGKSTVNLNRKLKSVGKSMTKMGKRMSIGISLPIAAVGGISLKAASDFEEAHSKFETVFSSIKDEANSMADNLAKNFGLSKKEAIELAGSTGDLLTGFGVAQETALGMSQSVQELAADLASFTNAQGGTKAVSEALTKALLGERESLKTYGIAILDADVKARIAAKGLSELTGEAMRQAKAQVTLELATEQSKNAVGDFARTQGSFANQTKIIRARLDDLSVQIGQIILPFARKIVAVFSDWVESFMELSPATKKIILIIGVLVAAIGPLLLALGFLTSTVLPAVATGMSMVLGPIGLVIMAIGAMVAIVYTFWDEIVSAFVGARAAIMKIGENIANGFRKIPELMFEAWQEFPKAILDSFKDLGSLIKAVITGDFEAIPGILKSGAANVLKANPLGGLALKLGKEFGVGVADEFVTAFQGEMKSRSKEVEEVVKLPDITTTAGPTLPTAPSGGGKVDVTKKINEQAEAYKKVRKSIADAVTTARLFGDEEVTVAEKMDIVRGGIESAIVKFGENSKVVQALKMDFDALGQSMTEGISLEEFQDKVLEVIDTIAMVMDSFSTIATQSFKNQEIAMENRYKKEVDLINNSKKTQEQKEKALAKLNDSMEKKRSALAVKRAKAEKAQALLTAIVNTAASVTKVIANPLMAVLVAALGAAQIATIAAQTIPALAEGGLAFGETLSVVGDNPNARTDPEVIAPLSKLKDLISFDNINLTSTIRGEDLILVTNRTNANRGFIQ